MKVLYSPHLSADFEAIAFDKGEGLALSIIQVCNEDGKIHNMSFLALSTDFSNLLYCAADMLYQAVPFDLEEHRRLIAAVYNKLTDEELAENCDEELRWIYSFDIQCTTPGCCTLYIEATIGESKYDILHI